MHLIEPKLSSCGQHPNLLAGGEVLESDRRPCEVAMKAETPVGPKEGRHPACRSCAGRTDERVREDLFNWF